MVDSALKSYAAKHCRNSRVFTRWPLLREVFNVSWYSVDGGAHSKQLISDRLHALMSQVGSLAEKSGCLQYILEDNSFPSGRYRSVSRQWNLIEMDEMLSAFAEVKYIALYRDPIAMAFSHPEFDDGLINHSRVVADFLEYLNGQLLQLDNSRVRVVHYEDLLDDQDRLARPLAEYLDIGEDDIRLGFRHIRWSGKDWRLQLQDNEKMLMRNYFSLDRLALWPIFHDADYGLVSG